MEALLAQQAQQLQEEQYALEQQLYANTYQSIAKEDAESQPHTQRKVEELPPHEKEEEEEPFAADDAPTTRGMSLHERLGELEAIKRRYQRHANRAMNEYFTAAGGVTDYHSKREEKINSVKPFSFDARERMRTERIRERRAAEEQAKREREMDAMLNNKFQAKPVPPTTFMNKYDVMVEEWCQRKIAAEMMAKERAEIAKEEAAFIRLSAQGLRHTREELLGAKYDPVTGQNISRNQIRQRAQSAHAARERAEAAEAIEVPLDVRMRLWPAIKEHEQIRKERIKQVAAERKQISDEYVQKVMPLLSSPTPSKLPIFTPGQAFGIGQPIATPVPVAAAAVAAPPAAAVAAPIPPGPMMPLGVAGSIPLATNVPAPVPLQGAPVPQVPTPIPTPAGAPVPQPAVVAVAGAVPFPQAVAAPTTTEAVVGPNPSSPAAAAPSAADASKKAAVVYNPNLTFKPKVKPGVPNFAELWAEDKVSLLERKKKRKPTVPQAFNLAPSAKDGVVRGKKVIRSASQPVRRAKSRSQQPSAQQSGTTMNKGTRAHALRTEVVYSKYLKETKDEDNMTAADRAYWAEVKRRRREISKRMAPYLTNTHLEHDAEIRSKVKALRSAMKESDRSAKEKLEEMKSRVSQMPPVFAEPVHLNALAEARADAEKDIMKLLQDTGLDAQTIKEILTKPPVDEDAAADIPAAATEDGATGASTTEAAEKDKEGTASPKVKKPSKRSKSTDGSSSSGSSSDSDSMSSFESESSSSSAKETKSVTKSASSSKSARSNYSSDSFESSSSDD